MIFANWLNIVLLLWQVPPTVVVNFLIRNANLAKEVSAEDTKGLFIVSTNHQPDLPLKENPSFYLNELETFTQPFLHRA